MKNVLIILVIIIILATIGLIILARVTAPAPEASSGTNGDQGLGVGEQPISVPPNAESVMITTLQNGETTLVRDVRVPEYDVGDGLTFVIAGGLNESEPRYAITYFANYDYFQISLEAEPLAVVRRDAEFELATALNIDPAMLCSMNVSVRTSRHVNDVFAGRELGLDDCPNHVKLD